MTATCSADVYVYQRATFKNILRRNKSQSERMYVYAASSLPYMIQHQINQYPLRWKNDNDDDKNEQSNKNMQISVKCTQKISNVCEKKLENMTANGQQLR